jgi:hypothetical protein
MGQYETIRGNVADVYVVNSDIASTARITDDKLALNVPKWSSGTYSADGTTAVFTWTCTNACTVLDAIVQITAAASANQAGVLQETTGTTQLIPSHELTAAATIRATVATALGSHIPVIELAAGASLEYTSDANTGDVAGKYFILYTETPS